MSGEKYLKNFQNIDRQNRILICFAHAGGSAAVFKNWEQGLEELIHTCPVQLPGRSERVFEPPFLNMELLLEDMLPVIRPLMSKEVYFFGHSMGAKIAYELVRRLEQEGIPASHLIVAANRVPTIPEPAPIFDLPEKEFIEALIRFGGVPEEVFADEELMAFFLPLLRADFIMGETYCARETIPVSCPITALGGTLDYIVRKEEIRAWSDFTTSAFKCHFFSGDHFFTRDKEAEVLNYIKEEIICNYG